MKAFIILLVLAGLGVGGFFGYQYLEKEGMLPWQTADSGGDPKSPDGSDPENLGTPDGTTPKPGIPDTVTKGDPIAEMYPIPDFQTLEQITDNWTKIPARAFPRPVKLKEPVSIQLGTAGSSTFPAGKEMTALGMNSGKMVVAPTPTSTARAEVSPKSTDIVDVIAERYEIFKKEQIARVMAQRESEKKRQTEAKTMVAASSGSPPTPVAASRPTKAPSSDPRFAPMIASIKGGDSAEIEMKNIQSWRWGGKTKEGGQEYDYGLITYSVDTLFGTMDTEAMALIKNGKVQKWVYTGSGDEVP